MLETSKKVSEDAAKVEAAEREKSEKERLAHEAEQESHRNLLREALLARFTKQEIDMDTFLEESKRIDTVGASQAVSEDLTLDGEEEKVDEDAVEDTIITDEVPMDVDEKGKQSDRVTKWRRLDADERGRKQDPSKKVSDRASYDTNFC
jgi:hypothetical protein